MDNRERSKVKFSGWFHGRALGRTGYFNPCFHVQYLRAVLRYRASKDRSYAGDQMYAGFRDNPKTQESQATAGAGQQ